MRVLNGTGDVTPRVLALAEDTLDWFGDDERIDWDLFTDRLAEAGNHEPDPWDIESYDCPAVRKIKRHVRALREGQ